MSFDNLIVKAGKCGNIVVCLTVFCDRQKGRIM